MRNSQLVTVLCPILMIFSVLSIELPGSENLLIQISAPTFMMFARRKELTIYKSCILLSSYEVTGCSKQLDSDSIETWKTFVPGIAADAKRPLDEVWKVLHHLFLTDDTLVFGSREYLVKSGAGDGAMIPVHLSLGYRAWPAAAAAKFTAAVLTDLGRNTLVVDCETLKAHALYDAGNKEVDIKSNEDVSMHSDFRLASAQDTRVLFVFRTTDKRILLYCDSKSRAMPVSFSAGVATTTSAVVVVQPIANVDSFRIFTDEPKTIEIWFQQHVVLAHHSRDDGCKFVAKRAGEKNDYPERLPALEVVQRDAKTALVYAQFHGVATPVLLCNKDVAIAALPFLTELEFNTITRRVEYHDPIENFHVALGDESLTGAASAAALNDTSDKILEYLDDVMIS